MTHPLHEFYKSIKAAGWAEQDLADWLEPVPPPMAPEVQRAIESLSKTVKRQREAREQNK
jgi:hypothetical protein